MQDSLAGEGFFNPTDGSHVELASMQIIIREKKKKKEKEKDKQAYNLLICVGGPVATTNPGFNLLNHVLKKKKVKRKKKNLNNHMIKTNHITIIRICYTKPRRTTVNPQPSSNPPPCMYGLSLFQKRIERNL
jgi:hypothetical protein